MRQLCRQTNALAWLVAYSITLVMSACGGSDQTSAATATGQASAATATSGAGPTSGSSAASEQKSAKRGIAYDLTDTSDFAALSPGVSWWYDWSLQPNAQAPTDYFAQYQMDFYPMLWDGHYDAAAVEAFLLANPSIKYLLVVNEPNSVTQANLTPDQAAQLWPGLEAIAAATGVKIVGPAITWGTMPGYSDPVVWLDAFFASYQSANDGRDPQIDYLAFHWYDYGLSAQLDRLRNTANLFGSQSSPTGTRKTTELRSTPRPSRLRR